MKDEDKEYFIASKNENKKFDKICEECKNFSESVRSNLIMHGFKVCDSCKLAKNIFPV